MWCPSQVLASPLQGRKRVWTRSRPRGSNFLADDTVKRIASDTSGPYGEAPDPYQDESRWPAWKVSVFVIVFTGICGSAIGYIATRLFG